MLDRIKQLLDEHQLAMQNVMTGRYDSNQLEEKKMECVKVVANFIEIEVQQRLVKELAERDSHGTKEESDTTEGGGKGPISGDGEQGDPADNVRETV